MKKNNLQQTTITKLNLESFLMKLELQFDNSVEFSDSYEACCVCMVDVVNSTKIIASLPKNLACRYYTIFLNSMTLIAKEFQAKIVKNVGDCLLYYFPKFMSQSKELKIPIECGLLMLESHSVINEIMFGEGLPTIDYRVSADCGWVMTACCSNFITKDIFGSTVNVCSKINGMTNPNCMAIGQDLYQNIKELTCYKCEYLADFDFGLKFPYSIYQINRKNY